jgi:ureidoglycolate hydrolase
MLLQVQILTREAWAPFGWLPVRDTDAADGAHTLEFTWGDPHLNVISHGPEEIERDAAGAVVSRMYRHDTHTQALMALNCPGVVAVAPADARFQKPADLEAISAFAIEPLAAVVLHRGTWHWGPFPTGADPILLLNVQGRRYIEDNASADVAAVGPVVVAIPA